MKQSCQIKILTCAIAALLVVVSHRILYAQEVVMLTTQVTPPYDGSFASFHNKVMVTLTNSGRQGFDVALEGRLNGNGITVEFRPNPDPVFFVSGGQTLVIQQNQLMPYFQEQNVAVTGMTKDELYRGAGLPPGTYQLCFRARNVITGAYLSMEQPSGCFSFSVQPPTAGGGEIRLNTQIIPPYATYLDDYVNQNKLLIILQNQTGSAQSLRLTGSIKGNNGVEVVIPASFVPSRPIELAARQVLTLSGNALREYFGESVLQIRGSSREEIMRGNGLPEGTYQACFQVVGFRTGEPLSAGEPVGCTTFEIRQYEPPLTIQPACSAVVNANQPQNILFTWSVPAGVRPDQVEYVFKVIDLNPQNIDPNQAMLSANVPPLFEKVVQTNSYMYSLADPKLEIGRRYAYRVTARTNLQSRRGRRNGPLNFRNNGHSPVCTFTYGATATNEVAMDKLVIANEGIDPGYTVKINPADVLTPPVPQSSASPDPTDSDQCIATCTINAPANSTPKNISSGDVVKVGMFTMTVTSGNSVSGTGTVMMNFLNTPINVSWNNIQVNANNELFGAGSKLTAVMDLNQFANAPYVTGSLWNGNDVELAATAIRNLVQQSVRRVSHFPVNNQQAIGLPVALDHGNFDLVIIGLVFSPTEASMNAVSLIELHNSTTAGDHLILSASSCVRPNGFGNATEVMLGANKTIPLSANASMVLNKDVTSASFDCQGISQVNLNGSLVFDRSLVLPVNNNGSVIPAPSKVSASFNTAVTDFNDWTLSVNDLSHSFTIPDLVGFRMTASQITIDQSDAQTPAGIGKPQAWKGIHIGSLQIILNGVFLKNNNPLSFAVNNFSLDHHGFSGDIDPPGNVLQLNEGKLGTWPVAVDAFNISINNSSIDGSSIEGRLKLPIAANELNYSVIVLASASENEVADFEFHVEQATELEADMWFASIDLDGTSTIGVEKVGNDFRPRADLTGSISINWNPNNGPAQNNKVGTFEMPELDFEHLTIQDNGNALPDVNVGVIEVANADGFNIQLASFDVQTMPPSFTKSGSKIGLTFGLDLELIEMANSLKGETAFTIFAEYENGEFGYKETVLNKIALGGDIGVAYMTGEVDIYSNDATYGNGFRGEINVVINALGGAGVDAVLQVGRVNNFNYWYFDVMANLGVAGFNIPGTMASVYGLGGGAWGNMTRSETPAQTVDQLNETAPYSHEPGANKGGLTFTPQQGTFGFSAALALGLTGAPAAFNGDLKFSMQLLSTGAVQHAIMEGGCYLMQDITDRDDGGLITGSLYAEIQPRIPNASDEENAAANRPNFKFNVAMDMDIANGMVTGQGELDLFFSPAEWWIKLGEWQNEDVPWEDNARMNITIDLKVVEAQFYSYFMMGSNISGMPKMPLAVREVFQQESQPLNPAPRVGLLATNNPNSVPANPGIAFGAGSHRGLDLKFLVFYADLEFIKGFDILLKKYANSSCGPKIGINGWYAKGQAYFYLDVDVGIELDIWVWKGKAGIMAATTAATVQAALPNPAWLKGQFMVEGEVLNGLFSFNTAFRFELGEKCNFGQSTPFDEMPIVSDITPEKDEQGVHVYVVPETAFNFPKGEFFYDEEVDGEFVTKSYKYVFKTFTLKYKDPQTNANKEIDLKPHMNYRSDGLSATYYYSDMILPEHTDITYTIYVQGWQMAPGSPSKVYDETHTGTFRSGSWPAHIEPEFLVSGNPQFRENFFKKNDQANGYLEFTNPHGHFTDNAWWYSNVFKLGTYNAVSSGTFAYKARFRELETNEVYETEYTMATPNRMTFSIPPAMKNNRIYQLELVVKFMPPINTLAAANTNVNATYENVLLTGASGGGGMVAVQNLLNAQAANPTPAQVQQGSGNLQMASGNSQSNQQVLLNNYAVMTALGSSGSGQQPVNASVGPGPNPTFNYAQGNASGTGTYIQRKKNELIHQKKGAQGIEWSLFDDLPWYFKTSRYNTLQEKLADMKETGVVFAEYSGQYPRFNIQDAMHEPAPGEGTQVTISTKVPVILLEINETFEVPYEMGGYSITIANNPNETINVPPKVTFQHANSDWMANGFFGSATNPYHLPDADDWAKFPFYHDEDAQFLGYYGQLNHPYPGDHWENFIPDPASIDPWHPQRHSGGLSSMPFGNQNFSTPYEVKSGAHKPMQVFYKKNSIYGNIDFGNKGVVGFKTTPLEGDAINIAKAAGEQVNPDNTNDGVVFGGVSNYMGNLYGQVNPGLGPANDLVGNTKQHLAVIDYTEWVAMRDLYHLHKYVYERNEEEEGFFECAGNDYNCAGTTNCYCPSIKNWVNNVWRYKGRPGGTYYFRLGGPTASREFDFTLNTTLNPED